MRSPWSVGPLVLVALALAGCTSGGTPAASTAPRGTPTPASSVLVGPSPSPVAAAPSPVPSPSPIATAIDRELVLRADAVSDVVGGRIHGLYVYRDGTVLRGVGPGGITRLTPAALDSHLAEVLRDPAVIGGNIGADPAHQAGFTSYFVAVRDGDHMTGRGVTNASPPDRRAEADEVITLVERLLALDTWLPEDSWTVPPQASEPWVPARYQLKVVDWGYPGDVALPVDVADIDWPFPGSPTDFGALIEGTHGDTPGDPNAPRATRCGVVGLGEALAVQAALNAGLGSPEIRITEQEWSVADLAWAERETHLTISLRALLPDDPSDCIEETPWP